MINQSLKSENDTEGATNVKTLMFGGILYILAHAYLWTPGNPFYFYKEYLWYIILLDCSVMGYTYKHYFGRTILDELDPREKEKYDYDENTHTYTRKETKEVPKGENKEEMGGGLKKVLNEDS